MKPNNLIFWCVLIGLIVCTGAPAFSQKASRIADIPGSLSVHTQYQEIVAERARLVKERSEIRGKTESHNRQCTGVEENSALAATCEREQTLLQNGIAAHNREVQKFNDRVRDILIADSSKPISFTVGVSSIRGEATIETRAGSRLTDKDLGAGRAIRIDIGTRVITGSTGRLQVVLPDDTVFTIGPNSDMVIDEFVYDPDLTPRKIAVSVTKGIFRWVTGKVARKDPAAMRVKLPVGTIGIRGTDVETVVDADGSGSVALYSGIVEISPLKGGSPFLLREKTIVSFNADGMFNRPRAIEGNKRSD